MSEPSVGMASLQAVSVNRRMPHGALDGTTRAVKVAGSILGTALGTEACRVTVLACTRVAFTIAMTITPTIIVILMRMMSVITTITVILVKIHTAIIVNA